MGWKRAIGYRQPSLRVALFGRRNRARGTPSGGSGCLGCLAIFAALLVLSFVLRGCGAVAASPVAIVSMIVGAAAGLATTVAWRGRASHAVELAEWTRARQAHEARRAWLLGLDEQFGWEATNGIARQLPWQGQTADMVVASFGRPVEVDEKVMKSKTTNVFKYLPFSNRFALRVTLENGLVVGWDDQRQSGPTPFDQQMERAPWSVTPPEPGAGLGQILGTGIVAFAAFIVMCASAAKTTHQDAESKADASGAAPRSSATPVAVSPSDVCAKLVVAKVAANCSQPSTAKRGTFVTFDMVGVKGYNGTVAQYQSPAEFDAWAKESDERARLLGAAADDYPELDVRSSPNRISVDWAVKAELETKDGYAWRACVQKRKVAACAKEIPTYYGVLHKLYEAATQAVR